MEEELFPSDTALNTLIPHNCLHKIMHSQGFQEPVRVSVHTSYKKWQKSNILASQSLSRMWLWWSGQRNVLFKEAGEGTRWIIDRPGGETSKVGQRVMILFFQVIWQRSTCCTHEKGLCVVIAKWVLMNTQKGVAWHVFRLEGLWGSVLCWYCSIFW